MARSIVAYVDETLDNARLGPVHKRVLAIISAGLFFDVIDFIILGSLVPDMLRTHFATPAGMGTSAPPPCSGCSSARLGQGELTDRFGRRAIFQFAVALLQPRDHRRRAGAQCRSGSRLGAWSPALALGAAAPLCFSYAAEYSPKRIRGRVTAFMQFVGGACVWPLGNLLALSLRDTIGWRGVWIIIGVGRPRRFRRKLSIAGIAALARHPRPRRRGPRSARRDGAGTPARRRNACSSMRSPTSAATRWRSSSAAIAVASSPR